MSYADELRTSERALMEVEGGMVDFIRGPSGEASPVRARFESRFEGLAEGTRAPIRRKWAAVMADDPGLEGEPPAAGDRYRRTHGKELRIGVGGEVVEGADGLPVAYHHPVAEVP